MNAAITNLHLSPAPGGVDERLTVDATVGGVQLSLSGITADTRFYVLDVQEADVFVTFDGSAPTTTNGHKLAAGSSMEWSIATCRAAKFIRSASTDAKIHASPFST